MLVGRKGALPVLLLMVLWTAWPVFACLTPVRHHSCCKGDMQDCASMMGADMTCCQMHGSDTSYPPSKLFSSQQSFQVVQTQAALAMMLAAPRNLVSGRAADAPPPGAPPGGFVLRI